MARDVVSTADAAAQVRVLNGTWKFEPVDRVIFGPGSAASVPESIERFGCRRVFLVTSPALVAAGLVEQLASLLGGLHVGTFSDICPHLPAANVVAATRAANAAAADAIVCVGAGSSIDGGKLVSLGLSEGWHEVSDLWRSAGKDFDDERVLVPVVAIPTNLMGAEVTAGAGFTDEQERKTVFMHPRLAPDVIVLDPEIARHTPRQLWVGSGIKAIDRTVDRLTSADRQPITAALARDAFRRLMEHLPLSAEDGPELVAHRGHCLVGSWLASFGAHNATWGLSIVLARHLGARCHIPHTLTSCITLPHSLRYLGRVAPDRIDDLAETIGMSAVRGDVAAIVASRLTELIRSMGLPYRLRDVGYNGRHADAIAAGTSEELAGSLEIPPEDVLGLLDDAW